MRELETNEIEMIAGGSELGDRLIQSGLRFLSKGAVATGATLVVVGAAVNATDPGE